MFLNCVSRLVGRRYLRPQAPESHNRNKDFITAILSQVRAVCARREIAGHLLAEVQSGAGWAKYALSTASTGRQGGFQRKQSWATARLKAWVRRRSEVVPEMAGPALRHQIEQASNTNDTGQTVREKTGNDAPS
jgi:hypothetical protein